MLYFFVSLILAVAASDHLIKFLIKTNIKDTNDVIFWKIFKIIYIENNGAAFGWFQGATWFFVTITILVVGYLFFLVTSKKLKDKISVIASALIIGGGIGNLIDRIIFGYVIDYIKLVVLSPVCNLSDFCVVIGVFIFIIHTFFVSKNKQPLKI